MSIKTREQSIESISNSVPKDLLKKAITGGYSDAALSFMADLRDKYLNKILDSSFSANAVNKLTEACESGKLGYGDLSRIVRFAPHYARHEKYIDDMLSSIDKGVFPTTAAKIFAAVGYEEMPYNEALDLVKSGAFYPTDYAGFSVTEDVSRELDKMCYPLRACEGFNHCYDIDSADRLEGALGRGAAITVSDKTIAVKVNEAMKREDWLDLRDYITNEMGEYLHDMSGSVFDELCADFECVKLSEVLYDKVRAEYDKFISDMRREPVDVVIESAYEIVWKDNITQYLENENPDISQKQYAALMTSKNTLDEIYEEWCSNGELHSYDDIGTVLECTANAISYSLEHNQKEQEQPPVIPEVKAEDIPAPTEPKRRSR